jgi:hypothetical protein
MEDVNVDSDTLHPGTIMPNGYRDANPKFKYTKETSQIEFIKNRIINVYKDSGNTGPLITDTVNTEPAINDTFVCIPNSNGQYPTHIECENAKISK